MEREPASSNTFTLRTHHLGILEDFLPDYYQFSEGKKPWEYSRDSFYKLIMFAKEYAVNEAGMDLTMRNYFERSVIDSPSASEDYAYLIDLIGTTKRDFDKVLEGRIDFFKALLETAFEGKDNKIILIAGPDSYCKSCAIGKHCKDSGVGKVNMDLVYTEALNDIKGFYGLSVTQNGEMFITTETFFDAAFYKNLEPVVEKIFQRELHSLGDTPA